MFSSALPCDWITKDSGWSLLEDVGRVQTRFLFQGCLRVIWLRKSKAVPELKVKLASPTFAWASRSRLRERVRSRVPWPLLQPWLLCSCHVSLVVQTSVPPRLVNTSSGCIDVCSMLLIIKVSHMPCLSPQEHHLTLKSYVVPPPSSTSQHRDPGSIKQPENINSSHRD